jgi:pSer/pThr/pTyr-binding forkhead associated (FHA) protein
MTQALSQKHLFVLEDEKGIREYFLDAPIYSIGRDSRCDIQIFSQFISRRHATLVQFANEDGSYSYRIIDGNLRGTLSSNGLRVNGCKVQNHVLQNDDAIDFGSKVRATYYLIGHQTGNTKVPEEILTTLIAS